MPRRSSSTWASARSRRSCSPIRSATTWEGRPTCLRRLDVGAGARPGPRGDRARAARRRFVPHGLTTYPCESFGAGATFRTGGLVLRALWPADAGTPSEDPTSTRSSSSPRTATTDVFLPADAESDVTARLAPSGGRDPQGRAPRLRGSRARRQLRELRPRVAVISCGRNNDYGHPRAETVAALESAPGLALYRTDEDGRVVVESDGPTSDRSNRALGWRTWPKLPTSRSTSSPGATARRSRPRSRACGATSRSSRSRPSRRSTRPARRWSGSATRGACSATHGSSSSPTSTG